ncbi:hypothetical protein Pcinc_022700 [Petrolisthes cinctipes]|uniref:Uncharacterized protein n=1 Tax=Petrolisthes cinctipes TaxID=88211 RepID=A0AAE1KGD0_PETCI|nr:hypothetical protein Pcinc_022700 [Petrolisthes cinctipes]
MLTSSGEVTSKGRREIAPGEGEEEWNQAVERRIEMEDKTWQENTTYNEHPSGQPRMGKELVHWQTVTNLITSFSFPLKEDLSRIRRSRQWGEEEEEEEQGKCVVEEAITGWRRQWDEEEEEEELGKCVVEEAITGWRRQWDEEEEEQGKCVVEEAITGWRRQWEEEEEQGKCVVGEAITGWRRQLEEEEEEQEKCVVEEAITGWRRRRSKENVW